MSIGRGMDKEEVVHMYSGILLSLEKARSNGICSDMLGPRDAHPK